MKKTLLILTTLVGSMTFAQDCSELFISEYVEGWSNNKALEIYNPTTSTIDLSQYMVVRYSNGSTTATAANAIQLTGMIGPGMTHVGVLDKQDPNGTGQEAPVWDSLAARADAFYCPVYTTSNAFYWNGDDAIVLAKGNVNDIPNAQVVDIFGKIGEDPGVSWTTAPPYTSDSGNGDYITKDHSLIRKATVLKGVTNPVITEFNGLLEYDSIPPVYTVITPTDTLIYGNWGTLGSHTCNCVLSVDEVSLEKVTVYPNPTTGQFFVNNVENVTSIVVLNSLGQVIESVENNSKAIVKFNMADRKGVYFIQLEDGNGNTITKKVIVK